METDASMPMNVPTARWVALAMLLVTLLSLAGFFESWRDFEYSQNTRMVLTSDIQAIQDRYDTALISLQRQLTEAETKDRDLQGELSLVSNRLQLAQDEVELARRQARQWTQRSSVN